MSGNTQLYYIFMSEKNAGFRLSMCCMIIETHILLLRRYDAKDMILSIDDLSVEMFKVGQRISLV